MPAVLMIVCALSWLISAVLIIDVWRREDSVWFKAMFVLIVLLPVLGPFFYIWIRSFPTANSDDRVDQQRYELDVLNRWRYRFERAGWLPPRASLKSKRGQERDPTAHTESIWSEAQADIAEAEARAAKRKRKRLRKARLYNRLTRKH